jgi:hypothetical protein
MRISASHLLSCVLSIGAVFTLSAQSVPNDRPSGAAAGKDARAQWVLQRRLSNPYEIMQGCTPNADWPNFDLLKFICNDEGYAQKAMLYKDGYSPTGLDQIRSLGFKAILLTQSNLAIVGSKPDTYLVITPRGLVSPHLATIPIDATPVGRWEFAELMYAKWRLVPDCQASVFGTDADGIYVACPRFTSSVIDNSYSNPDDAKNLSERGFKILIYGDQQQFFPATVGVAGFGREPAFDGDTLHKKYGINTAAMVKAKGDHNNAYQEFVEQTTRKLLDYSIKRKSLSLHSKPSGQSEAWRVPVDKDEIALFDELHRRALEMERQGSDASLEKDLEAQAKTYFSGGKLEPYAGDMVRDYIAVKPESNTASALNDLLREIHASLNCNQNGYCDI